MAQMTTPPPKGWLTGTQFLSLEHVARMVISVILPVLTLAGINSAFSLWAGGRDGGAIANFLDIGVTGSLIQTVAYTGVSLATAIIVLSGLFWLFNQRVTAELTLRPHYARRLAYSLPLYGAFFVSAAILVLGAIDLLSVILNSLTLIGVPQGAIGQLYLTHFLPELIGLLVIAFTAWYQYQLIKGSSKGVIYSIVMMVMSVVLALTLLITAVVTVHSSQNIPGTPTSSPGGILPCEKYLNNNYGPATEC